MRSYYAGEPVEDLDDEDLKEEDDTLTCEDLDELEDPDEEEE